MIVRSILPALLVCLLRAEITTIQWRCDVSETELPIKDVVIKRISVAKVDVGANAPKKDIDGGKSRLYSVV